MRKRFRLFGADITSGVLRLDVTGGIDSPALETVWGMFFWGNEKT